MKPTLPHARSSTSRHGISLLEVLISMGILTVGLLSVLALVPAGKSQAVKATIYDRSAVMASNVAADLIARGLLRTSSWKTGTAAAPIAVFDPLYSGSNKVVVASGTTDWPPLSSGTTTGISLLPDAATTGTTSTFVFSSSTFSGVINGSGTTGRSEFVQSVCDLLYRSEDDVLYTLDNVGPDDPPLPQWSVSLAGAAPAGRRAFEGLYSFLATVQTSATTAPSWDAATPATLTIVAFQRRDPTSPPIVLQPDDNDPTTDTWGYSSATLPTGQKIKDLLRPGTMVLWMNDPANLTAARWYRVVLAAEQQSGSVALTCEGGDPDSSNLNARVFVFPGAVGGIELPVKLEGTSVWNR
jgi:Tfp pilus assembly protein PilV